LIGGTVLIEGEAGVTGIAVTAGVAAGSAVAGISDMGFEASEVEAVETGAGVLRSSSGATTAAIFPPMITRTAKMTRNNNPALPAPAFLGLVTEDLPDFLCDQL
jgi:hypothetical protein